MMLLLVLPALALTCDEVLRMRKVGVPDDVVVATVSEGTFTAGDVECLRSAGVPQPLVDAARVRIQAGPAPAPPSVVEKAPPAPVLPPLDARTALEARAADAARQYRPAPAECSVPMLLATLPDAGAAAALSGTLGFGAGHFYVGRPGAGVAHFIIQAVGVGLVVRGTLKDEPVPLGIGIGMASIGRIVDATTAPKAAHVRAAELVAGCE